MSSHSINTSFPSNNSLVLQQTNRHQETQDEVKIEKLPPNLDCLRALMPHVVNPGRYVKAENRTTQTYFVSRHQASHFFVEQDPNDAFRIEVYKQINVSESNVELRLENKDVPEIMVPDADAIESQSAYYFEKYGIVIRMANEGAMLNILDDLNEKINLPMYVGMVVTWHNLNVEPTAHVAPFLFFFPGTHVKRDIECVSMDSTGRELFLLFLEEYGVQPKNIYRPTKHRQADFYSCHTDALVILRNALLSLRYHRRTGGFKEALLDAQLEGNNIIDLPPEWDYTSQISNTLLNTNQFAIRSFFSKKPKKPQTAEEHRKAHREVQNYFCTFYHRGASTRIAAPPPAGVSYKWKTHYWEVSFNYPRTTNTYLLRKGHEIAKWNAVKI